MTISTAVSLCASSLSSARRMTSEMGPSMVASSRMGSKRTCLQCEETARMHRVENHAAECQEPQCLPRWGFAGRATRSSWLMSTSARAFARLPPVHLAPRHEARTLLRSVSDSDTQGNRTASDGCRRFDREPERTADRCAAARQSQARSRTATRVPKRKDLQRIFKDSIVEIVSDSGECDSSDARQFGLASACADARLHREQAKDTVQILNDRSRRGRPVLGPPRVCGPDLRLSVVRDFDSEWGVHAERRNRSRRSSHEIT